MSGKGEGGSSVHLSKEVGKVGRQDFAHKKRGNALRGGGKQPEGKRKTN